MSDHLEDRIEAQAIESFYAVNTISRVAYGIFYGMLGFFATQVDGWRIILVGVIYAIGIAGMEITARNNQWIGRGDVHAARHWRNTYLPWLCLCGFAWALMPVLFDIQGRLEVQAVGYLSVTAIVYGNLVERAIDSLTFRCYHLLVLIVCVLGSIEPLWLDFSLPRLAVFMGFLGGMGYCWHMAKALEKVEWQRIRLMVEAEHAHEELHDAYMELERVATTDSLTGLYNRARLDDVLKTEVARSHRYGQPFSVILLDIDNFKSINDTYGHPVGDVVLRHVGTMIREMMRKPDIAGRWGGEEFLFLCPETGCEDAVNLAERLRRTLEINPPQGVPQCTGSFGVACLHEGEQESNLLTRADEALYIAKSQGKNQVTCHPKECCSKELCS